MDKISMQVIETHQLRFETFSHLSNEYSRLVDSSIL